MIRTFLLALGVTAMTLSFVSAQAKKPQPKKESTPAADIQTLPNFNVELIHTSDAAVEGSWINMVKDGKGRLVVSGQRGHPMLRFSLKDGKVEATEKLNLPISEAMGLLWAFDHLYVNGAGPEGFGLYKCKEIETGKFDVKFLKKFDGAGEHGPHGLAVGPDNKIYIMNGNHTKLPEGLSPNSPYKNYREDHVIPRQWDGNGHAAGIFAPGGYVVRTDADGKDWDLVLGGFRNAYDIAFNADGELFTFDSDMEWDWGMPWYRPTRVNHCVSGSEHGWRSGTGVWPDHYIDSLPPTANIGVGSPTGVGNGLGAKFPVKYQKALYVLDWTYGRIMAVHLAPNGSSYTGTFENFVAPKGLDGKSPKKPLNVTDIVVGDDGAMYFTTGGRNTQSGLYRVTYTGKEPTAQTHLGDASQKAARELRHSLEASHGKVDPKAVEAVWKHLGSPDRFLSSAARVALESQPVSTWKANALAEKSADIKLPALLALARVGDFKDQADLHAELARKYPFGELTETAKLAKLRILQVSFSRHGSPTGDMARKIIAELDPLFPSASEAVNRELVQVLVYLQSPTVLAKSLAHMAKAKVSEDAMHYVFHLRTLPVGFWSMDQRKEYLAYYSKDRTKLTHPPELLKWFEQAGRPYGDGSSYANFLKNFLKEYVSNMSPAERKDLEPILVAIDKNSINIPEAKPRTVVKKWTADELIPLLDGASKGRNFERGKQAYIDAQCAKCHRFADFGGSVGPDLTAISSRFARRDILDSLLEPSKVLSEQFMNEEFVTLDGKTVVGRVVDDSKDSVAVQPDSLDPKRITIKKADIDRRRPSKLSPMPANLVDVLSQDEILDLIAYMESGGRKNSPAFSKK